MPTNFPHGITSFGAPVMPWGAPFSKDSRAFFVDTRYGADGVAGTFKSPLKSIVEAEDRCIADQHDTVFFICRDVTAANTTEYLSAALTWDKDLTHLIGIGAESHVGQRTRIEQHVDATGLSPLITISASGCVFRNLYIFQGVADATSLINVRVSGQRNTFYRVHFAGGGHADQAIDGGASLNLYASASENKFVECVIGVDTIAAAAGMMGMVLSGSSGSIHTTRNLFEHCLFTMKAGDATAGFIELTEITAIDRYTIFDHCHFINLAAQAMNSVVVCPAGFDPNDKRLIMYDTDFVGAAAWDAADRGVVLGNMGTPTGLDTSGMLLDLLT
jgi:hypothetical protein